MFNALFQISHIYVFSHYLPKFNRIFFIQGLLEPSPKVYKNTTIMVYDLHNDALIRTYEIPSEQTTEDSFFANIAVEDEDCDVCIYLMIWILIS